MITNVTAKFKCVSKLLTDADYQQIKFSAVYSSDPKNPNYSWSKYTPSGDITMNVSNENACDFFEVGKSYLLSFAKATD